MKARYNVQSKTRFLGVETRKILQTIKYLQTNLPRSSANQKLEKNKRFKGTIVDISSAPPCTEEWHVRFTTVGKIKSFG